MCSVASTALSPSSSTRSSRHTMRGTRPHGGVRSARFAGLGKHVDRPLVLEDERVGEVVVALRAPCAAATTRRPDPLPRPRSPRGASP